MRVPHSLLALFPPVQFDSFAFFLLVILFGRTLNLLFRSGSGVLRKTLPSGSAQLVYSAAILTRLGSVWQLGLCFACGELRSLTSKSLRRRDLRCASCGGVPH